MGVWENYCVVEVWVYVVLQFVVDKVVQMFGVKIKWDQWCDKIGDLEEGVFGVFGEDNYYQDYVDQVVVE